MGGLGFYLVFLIPPLVVGLFVQHRLNQTVSTQMQVAVANGMSGEEVALMILQHNGLAGVPVNPAAGGPLSDHYDPRNRTVNLSQDVYSGRSVASVAIAAHEVGHAIQHAKAYAPFKVRSAMAPAVGFASSTWFILFIIAIFAQITGLATLAIVLFGLVVLFQVVTLPVEFDASRRAKQQLNSLGLVTAGEAGGASKVLGAAALTYVAAALVALTQLVYLIASRR
jgi:Zn-dependent membrane protease YugP